MMIEEFNALKADNLDELVAQYESENSTLQYDEDTKELEFAGQISYANYTEEMARRDYWENQDTASYYKMLQVQMIEKYKSW